MRCHIRLFQDFGTAPAAGALTRHALLQRRMHLRQQRAAQEVKGLGGGGLGQRVLQERGALRPKAFRHRGKHLPQLCACSVVRGVSMSGFREEGVGCCAAAGRSRLGLQQASGRLVHPAKRWSRQATTEPACRGSFWRQQESRSLPEAQPMQRSPKAGPASGALLFCSATACRTTGATRAERTTASAACTAQELACVRVRYHPGTIRAEHDRGARQVRHEAGM